MFPIAAINDTESSRSRAEALAPTKEAQEFHLTKLYQDALVSLQAGDLSKARNLFQTIIHDPLSIKAQREATSKNDTMLHLRFLTLKNLAETYVKQGPDSYKDGLQCYIQAVTIDEKDVVLWNRLGTVACSLGLLNVARKAFEQGLRCSPRHWSCMEKLVEVLIAIGDENGCLSVVKRLLKSYPAHPRALHIKKVIDQRSQVSGMNTVGIDNLEPQHRNLTFPSKRKLDTSSVDGSKPKKRKQHTVQLALPEPSWLLVVKATTECFHNRQDGKVLKGEELKDRSSYLANSKVLFSVQSSDGDDNLENSSQTTTLTVDSEKSADHRNIGHPPPLCLENDHRRSTRLERLRSRKLPKMDEADGPNKSLTQLLEPFIVDQSIVKEVNAELSEVKEVNDGQPAHYDKIDGCLVYSTLKEFNTHQEDRSHISEAEEVRQFMKDHTNNSGLYHIGQGLLEKVSKCSGTWIMNHTGLVLDLDEYTRQWGKSRSSTCSLFLAELHAYVAASNADTSKISHHLSNCSYNMCKVVECLSLDVKVETDEHSAEVLQGSIARRNDWVFWTRFHWLNARYCMLSGNPKKGCEEFRKCLSLLQSQQDCNAALVLPHCKVDNRISIETVEQKLYEFEVGDLLKNSAMKMDEQGRYPELIELLVPAVFSDLASKTNVWSSGKCSEALLNALNMLITACRRSNPINTVVQMKCHLRKLEILCHCAGICYPKPEDEMLLSPCSLASPSSTEQDDEKAKECRSSNKAIAEEVRMISRCAKENPPSDDLPLGRIQQVLLMVLVHFRVGLLSRKHSSLSLSEQTESSYLVDTAVAFCRVQHLSPRVSLEQQVALLVRMHEMLAERGICGAGASCEEGEGSFLKLAIKHLLAMDVKLKQELNIQGDELHEGFVENIELEKRRKQLGLDNALDQCFFCLYGLNLKGDLESGQSDNLAVHKTTTCGEFQTRDQCATVLQYVLPYAKTCSKAGLAKLRKVLQAVRKQFPQPPAKMLIGNVIDAFLDNLEFDEVKFSEMVIARANIDDIMWFAFGKQQLEINAAPVLYATPTGEVRTSLEETTEPYIEVHQNLYYLLTQMEEVSASDNNNKHPGFVLTKEGEDFIDQNACLYKYDLLYNIRRFESWHKLAGVYDEEVDLMLNDGSKNVNVLDWRKNSRYTSRVESSRRRSRRCLMMSLALANTPSQQFQVHETLALVYYDTLQNTVPSYDQRSNVQKKDAIWISKCLNAQKHFELAYSLRPDWQHLFFSGKLAEKLGKPSEEAFSFYKRAMDMNPSVVDPLYRLHRSRLKLLCKGKYQDVQIIQAVAKFCFMSTAEELVKNKMICVDHAVADEARQTEIACAWRVLFKDCISAMQACVDGELKHFHKARYCIAQGLYLRAEDQDWERAKEELAFCFRSSRSLFTINMWELDGVVKKNRRKATSSTSSKKTLELGLPEVSRKFITCVRKYLLLYIMLCEKAGDIVTLERAYSTLRADKRFSICLEDIANVALTGYIHALGAAINQAERSGSACSTSLQGLLERMFNLFMDHGVSWPEIGSDMNGSSDIADKSVYCYIHRYLHYLENDCRVDALELVNERIRKRFKNPKLSNPNFSQICRHATLAWCRALCSALASVTPTERTQEQQQTPAQLVVDLQYDVLMASPYDADILSKILSVSQVGTAEETNTVTIPSSAAYISRIKASPVVQVPPENIEKAQSYLRATFVFYREVTSGPFPNGINLFMLSPAGAPSEPTGSSVPVIPGYEPLDLSTPRKLLLWAYALVHGRAASIADVVKYCEEQAKSLLQTRLKKWPSAVPHVQQVAQEKAVKPAEQAVDMDITQTSKQEHE